MLLQMQSGERSSVIVSGARQVSAFANPLRVRVLMACATEECSLSALQRLTGSPLAKLHYHVSRLLAAELIVVSRTQRRAGRAIKFYRAAGESFIVPQEKLPVLPGDRLSVQLRNALREEQRRGGEFSLVYTSAPGGKMLMKHLPQTPTTPSRGVEMWRAIALNNRQRASLAKELGELLERYATAEPEAGAEALLVHAAFAPQRTLK